MISAMQVCVTNAFTEKITIDGWGDRRNIEPGERTCANTGRTAPNLNLNYIVIRGKKQMFIGNQLITYAREGLSVTICWAWRECRPLDPRTGASMRPDSEQTLSRDGVKVRIQRLSDARLSAAESWYTAQMEETISANE